MKARVMTPMGERWIKIDELPKVGQRLTFKTSFGEVSFPIVDVEQHPTDKDGCEATIR